MSTTMIQALAPPIPVALGRPARPAGWAGAAVRAAVRAAGGALSALAGLEPSGDALELSSRTPSEMDLPRLVPTTDRHGTPDATWEREILGRCRRGDEGAWRALYAAYAPTVSRFLRRRLGPHEDLGDHVQEVFVQFFLSLDNFRGEAKISTWLYRICSRVVSRRIRTEYRHRRRVEAYARHCLDMASTRQPDVVQQAEFRAVFEALIRVIYEELDEDRRAVWIMRILEGLSTRDVAEALELPAGTVRSRLHYAQRRVRAAVLRLGLAGSRPGGGPDGDGPGSRPTAGPGKG